jgi:peroxiredoxin family protein
MESKDKNRDKLSIICFSGDFDKAIAAFTLAAGAAATNKEVYLFFTFWGLNILRKNPGRSFKGGDLPTKMFNFLMGGVKCLPLSRLNFLGLSPKLMTNLMRKKNVATLNELIESTKALNVHLIACEMAMNILDIKREDLIDEVQEVIGVPTFLEYSKDAITFFIS